MTKISGYYNGRMEINGVEVEYEAYIEADYYYTPATHYEPEDCEIDFTLVEVVDFDYDDEELEMPPKEIEKIIEREVWEVDPDDIDWN